MTNSTQASRGQRSSTKASKRGRQIDSVAWAIYFIWIGIVILAQISWGWSLVGVAVVILASQFVRWLMGLAIEGFWVAGGAVFLAGGLWMLLDLPGLLVPILLILVGAAIIGKLIVDVAR